MSTFNSLEQMMKQVKKDVKASLNQEVATVIKKKIQEHVESDVYPQYEPTLYERRMKNGGLTDIENMHHTIDDKGNEISLNVSNDTTGRDFNVFTGQFYDNDVIITPIIESGEGYSWIGSRIYGMQPYPRPFMENTIKDLQSSKEHILALKQSLKPKGYKINN